MPNAEIDYWALFRAERAKVEELEETIRQLKEIRDASPERGEAIAWPIRLTPGERVVAGIFAAAKPNRTIRKDVIAEALKHTSRALVNEYAETSKIVDVFVHKVRKKIEPLGLSITTVYAEGFMVSDHDYPAWEKFIIEHPAS